MLVIMLYIINLTHKPTFPQLAKNVYLKLVSN